MSTHRKRSKPAVFKAAFDPAKPYQFQYARHVDARAKADFEDPTSGPRKVLLAVYKIVTDNASRAPMSRGQQAMFQRIMYEMLVERMVLALDVPLEDLAEWTFTSRSTVQRALKQWVRTGLVWQQLAAGGGDVHGTYIIIPAMPQWMCDGLTMRVAQSATRAPLLRDRTRESWVVEGRDDGMILPVTVWERDGRVGMPVRDGQVYVPLAESPMPLRDDEPLPGDVVVEDDIAVAV